MGVLWVAENMPGARPKSLQNIVSHSWVIVILILTSMLLVCADGFVEIPDLSPLQFIECAGHREVIYLLGH
jgi:hypothetical protein